MKKNIIATIMVLSLLCLTATGVLAGGTVSSVVPNSLLSIPTADVGRYGDLALGYSLEGEYGIFGATYGLTDQVQVGVAALTRDYSSVKFAGTVKVKVRDESSEQPGVALGLADDSVYAVVSKRILGAPDFRGHVGFGAGDLDGLFLGLTKVVNPVSISQNSKGGQSAPVVTLMAEMVRRQLNFGARLAFTKDFEVDLGVKGGGNLHMGLHYTFGL